MNHELPNMAEQTFKGVPNAFQRLEKGSQARASQRDAFRVAERSRLEDSRVTNLEQWLAARSRLIADGLVPVETTDSRGLPIRGAFPAAAALVLLIAACGTDKQIKISPATGTATENATAAATATATAKATETRTATAPPVTAEATPKAEVPCRVVPQIYCDNAVLLRRNTSQGPIRFIGINVPDGTPIYSPMNSVATKNTLPDGGVYQGKQVQVGSSSSALPPFTFIGNIEYTDDATADVKAGDTIATVGKDGKNNWGFKVVILIGPFQDNEKNINTIAKQLFPTILDKPIQEVASNTPSTEGSPSLYGGVVYNH